MRFDDREMKKIICLYVDENKSALEISKIMKCACQTIITYLGKYKIEIKNSGYWHKKVELDDIKRDYFDNNMTLAQIGKKYNIGTGSLCDRFKKAGIKLRDRQEESFRVLHKIPLSEHEKICKLYLDDETQNCGKIAKIYSVFRGTIANILRKNGIEIQKNKRTRNPAWKGGVTLLHDRIRNCDKANFWKRACIERDEYKCQINGDNKNLNVHHYPNKFADIFKDFLRSNSSLRPIEDCDKLFELSQAYEAFWDINNGVTVSENMHKKLHMKKGITDEEIVSLHNQGWSCRKISKHFGKSDSFALARLRSIGLDRRDISFYNKQRTNITEDIESGVVKDYMDGDKVRNIKNKYGVSASQLYKILERHNIEPGKRGKRDQRSDASKNNERVIKLYESGVTTEELSKIYNVSNTTIRNILKISSI